MVFFFLNYEAAANVTSSDNVTQTGLSFVNFSAVQCVEWNWEETDDDDDEDDDDDDRRAVRRGWGSS